MPKSDGFDVVERVGLQHLPPTVFVTAYHEHAVRAFDVHAVDYRTKPVDAERLARALWRVWEKIAAKQVAEKLSFVGGHYAVTFSPQGIALDQEDAWRRSATDDDV